MANESVLNEQTGCENPCLYCGWQEFDPLYNKVRDRLGFVPGDWSFVRCRNCGSANLRPFPRDEEIPGFYPPVYTFSPESGKGWLRRFLSTMEYRFFFRNAYRAQVNRIESHTNKRGTPFGKLLDIGCGHGLRLLEFQRRGYEPHGMDFVPDSVAYLGNLGIPAVCTDMQGLATAYEPETFNLITAFYILEHVTNVRQTLTTSLSLLKPGGWFVGAVPMIDSPQAILLGGRNINVCEAPRHISIPTQRGICDLAKHVGYDPSSIKLIPDSLLACAGSIGLSLVPGASTTNVYGSQKLLGVVRRLLGAFVVATALPWVAFENYYLRRPVLGLLIAQRPKS